MARNGYFTNLTDKLRGGDCAATAGPATWRETLPNGLAERGRCDPLSAANWMPVAPSAKQLPALGYGMVILWPSIHTVIADAGYESKGLSQDPKDRNG